GKAIMSVRVQIQVPAEVVSKAPLVPGGTTTEIPVNIALFNDSDQELVHPTLAYEFALAKVGGDPIPDSSLRFTPTPGLLDPIRIKPGKRFDDERTVEVHGTVLDPGARYALTCAVADAEARAEFSATADVGQVNPRR